MGFGICSRSAAFGSCLGQGRVVKGDEHASSSYPPSLHACAKGFSCTGQQLRAASQDSPVAIEGVSARAGDALGLPNTQDGATMETGTVTTKESTSVCFSRGKVQAALRKPHPLVAQPVCFSGIRKRDENDIVSPATPPPQETLHLHIPRWAYPLFLAEHRTCWPGTEAPWPFPNPLQPYYHAIEGANTSMGS